MTDDAERVRLSLVSICCERQRPFCIVAVDQADDDGVHRDQCDQTQDVQRIRVCFAAEDGGGYSPRRCRAAKGIPLPPCRCLEQTQRLSLAPALETLLELVLMVSFPLPASRCCCRIPVSSCGAVRESV